MIAVPAATFAFYAQAGSCCADHASIAAPGPAVLSRPHRAVLIARSSGQRSCRKPPASDEFNSWWDGV